MGSPLTAAFANMFMVFTNLSGLMSIILTRLNVDDDILAAFNNEQGSLNF